MQESNKDRWALCAVDADSGRFHVVDSLLRKRVTYYVPNLATVSIEGCNAYVHTSNGKSLLIQLDTNARRFIS